LTCFFLSFSFAVEIFNKNKFTKDSSIGVVTVPKLSLELDNASKEAWFPVFLPSKGQFVFLFLLFPTNKHHPEMICVGTNRR